MVVVVRTGAMLPVNQEIQHSPRIGVRISTEENSMGNDLSPPLVPLHPIQRIPAMDMEPSIGEVDCNELYTFRCGVNQCLPIPVWCDGKVDCDDRTGKTQAADKPRSAPQCVDLTLQHWFHSVFTDV